MLKAKCVQKIENETGSRIILDLEGVVIFSETKNSELDLIVDKEHGLKLKWCNYQSTAFIRVGDRIRGFYENVLPCSSIKMQEANLCAYELLDDKENVLTRSCKPDYAFVEAYDF